MAVIFKKLFTLMWRPSAQGRQDYRGTAMPSYNEEDAMTCDLSGCE